MKLYLMEKDILDSLQSCLKKEYNMEFKQIGTKFQGLKVITPTRRVNNKPIQDNQAHEMSTDSVFIMNE